jgi:NAD(P)-dependent dehydrogenase (short-subunit alcohol dehydrogenase family)
MPTILIIGANRGLGLEFARQYAEQGYRVIGTLRDPTKGAALSGAGAEIYVCDVSDPAQISRLAESLKEVELDILLINAGVFPSQPGLEGIQPASFMQAMAVNALAPLLLARAFLPQMVGPRIIAALSSKMGSVAENTSGGCYAYRTSKAALNMGFKSLSLDPLAAQAIVVILSPGWVKTDMGGQAATLAPSDAIAAMRKVLGGLTPQDNGRFIHYDGSLVPW